MAGPLVLVRDEAAALLAAWKKLLGAGGGLAIVTAADGSSAFELQIQGDHADHLWPSWSRPVIPPSAPADK